MRVECTERGPRSKHRHGRGVPSWQGFHESATVCPFDRCRTFSPSESFPENSPDRIPIAFFSTMLMTLKRSCQVATDARQSVFDFRGADSINRQQMLHTHLIDRVSKVTSNIT